MEDAIIICKPAEEAELEGYELNCVKCDRKVRVTPATMDSTKGYNPLPYCMDCAVKENILKTATIQNPTKEQIDEIIEHLRSRKHG